MGSAQPEELPRGESSVGQGVGEEKQTSEGRGAAWLMHSGMLDALKTGSEQGNLQTCKRQKAEQLCTAAAERSVAASLWALNDNKPSTPYKLSRLSKKPYLLLQLFMAVWQL